MQAHRNAGTAFAPQLLNTLRKDLRNKCRKLFWPGRNFRFSALSSAQKSSSSYVFGAVSIHGNIHKP